MQLIHGGSNSLSGVFEFLTLAFHFNVARGFPRDPSYFVSINYSSVRALELLTSASDFKVAMSHAQATTMQFVENLRALDFSLQLNVAKGIYKRRPKELVKQNNIHLR